MRETLKSWLKSHNAKADMTLPVPKQARTFWIIYEAYLERPVMACRSYEQACRICEQKYGITKPTMPYYVRQISR